MPEAFCWHGKKESCFAANVRYIVRDVDEALQFYCDQLGFKEEMHPVPDLAGMVETVRQEGVHFRNDIVTGVGGKQILIEDPSGNPVELLEPFPENERYAR